MKAYLFVGCLLFICTRLSCGKVGLIAHKPDPYEEVDKKLMEKLQQLRELMEELQRLRELKRLSQEKLNPPLELSDLQEAAVFRLVKKYV